MLEELQFAQTKRSQLEDCLRSMDFQFQKIEQQARASDLKVDALQKECHLSFLALGDRNSELDAKAALLRAVHDEVLSLTLQVNVMEERNRILEAENAQLLGRWTQIKS